MPETTIKPSLTIVGLVVIILGFLAQKFQIPIVEGNIETTLTTLMQVVGFIITAIGRYRHGDISLLGIKKGQNK